MNISEYKFKTELHAHTSPASSCSDIPAEDVIKNYAQIGYNSVVISNHFHSKMKYADNKEQAIEFFLSDFEKAVQAGKEYNINVILGCEIRFDENSNDYLLFGIDSNFLDSAFDYFDKGIEKFSEFFRNKERVLIQAHPFRNGMTDINPAFVDGTEAFNMHPGHNSRVAVSARHAAEHNHIITCGTDYHHVGHHGMCALLTKTEIKNSFELAKVLHSRDYLFQIGNSIILPYGI